MLNPANLCLFPDKIMKNNCMKNILFPTDFTSTSSHALIYALQIAGKFNATLSVVHIYEKPDVGMFYLPNTLQEFYEVLEEQEMSNFKQSIQEVTELVEKHGFQNVTLRHALVGGLALEKILETAKSEASDLIVMGTTGARSLLELFVGSLSGEVMEKAACPVLAVPEDAIFDGRIDNIVITTNFLEEDVKALNAVLDFASHFDATVHCVHADLAHTSEYTHLMDSFKAPFADKDKLVFEVLEGNDLYDMLTGYMQQQHCDLLAMISHQRNFIQELFHFSRVKMMAYHSSTPVLSIPAGLL